jgi:hypothetical protein
MSWVEAMRSAQINFDRLRRVPRADWPAVLITLGVAVAVEIGLRTLRLPTLARVFHVPLSSEHQDPSADPSALNLPPDAIRRLGVSACVMRHWPFDEKCLRRSLVCGYRIRSLKPQLVLGVALVDGEVKAHAWLTIGGLSLDPRGSASFSGLEPAGRP